MTTIVLSDLRRDEATPRGFTPADHPMRNIKPDPWMLKNARATAENIVRLTASIDLTPNASKDNRHEP